MRVLTHDRALPHTAIRVRHETRYRALEVVSAETLSPRMRRIVLGGDALAGFTTAAADDHVKLFLPAPGQQRPASPILEAGGIRFPEGTAPPTVRDYTPRRFDPASLLLTIEFVLHGDGPAAAWAQAATPGQQVGIGGPRGSLLLADTYDTYLLAGDETALPAIARRLEEMPPGVRAIALIEVETRGEERHLPTAASASITWLPRNGRPAGDPELLLQALAATRLPDGDTHAWIAAEIEVARRLKAHLLEERQIPAADIRSAGYWRHDAAIVGLVT
ncbi:siderophore-interacting protein [Lichenicola sp.]|uniref:siderophore-interacting protein n=1 Tax=Lichenicola sp. TaxID=2804529 RepID=UPI003AFF92B7